jgi:nucleoside triphosphatase
MSEEIIPKQYMRPGAKALILNSENKILVVTEKVVRKGVEQIIHDFPGGGIEFGEKLEDALAREVFEEVGLKIKVDHSVGNWDFVIDSIYHEGVKVHVICMGYQCRLAGSDKVDMSQNPAQENIFEYEWLTKEEILSRGAGYLVNPEMLKAVARISP